MNISTRKTCLSRALYIISIMIIQNLKYLKIYEFFDIYNINYNSQTKFDNKSILPNES